MARYQISFTQKHPSGGESTNTVEHDGPKGLGAALAAKLLEGESEGIVTTSVTATRIEDTPAPTAETP